MSDQFVGEIRIMANNFAPQGWALCQGQLLPLAQNTALFSLLGTTYGGNGVSTFALPDLRGRAPMFFGQGPGLTNRFIGETAGNTSVTLTTAQIPVHQHSYAARPTGAVPPQSAPSGLALARTNSRPYSSTAAAVGQMGTTAVGLAGGDGAHNNMMPYLTMNFIIALIGIYPPRS